MPSPAPFRVLAPLTLACCAAAASAAPEVRLVDPADTDPGIDIHLDPHATVIDPQVEQRGVLYVHLVGSCGTPEQNLEILDVAAEMGFHVVGLSYPNCPSLVDLIDPTSNDLDVHERVRIERLYGEDASPLVDVDVPNSIVNRLAALLAYLDAEHPDEGWDDFLVEEGGGAASGAAPRWQAIAVGGHSQGSGHAGLLAKDHALAGALYFAGPGDRIGTVDAPWLSRDGATPPERMIAFTHRLDIVWNRAIAAYAYFEMGPLIVVDDLPAPYFGRRVLTSLAEPGEPGAYHGCVVVDEQLARAADGTPIYRPVWETMLDVAGKPATAEDHPTGATP